MNLLPLDEILFQEEPRLYLFRGKGYESVTGYIKDALGDDFANVPQDRLEFCQGRGNAVHLAGAFLIAGELDWSTVDSRIEGYVRAIERFHKDCPGEIIYTEKRMVSRDLVLGGTPDLCKFIRGYRSLVDYKTSQQMKPRMRLQTAGYKELHDSLFPNAPIHRRYGLRLQPDSFYKLVPHDDFEDEIAFKDLRAESQARARAARWKLKYA